MSEPYGSPSTFRLRRRTPGTFVLVPCPKQGRSIRCQGQLEAAAAQVLVACPQVHLIEEQPRSIWYEWSEEPHDVRLWDASPTSTIRKTHRVSHIVPDFLVTMKDDRRRLVEIKPSVKLVRPDIRRKFTVGRLFAERNGWSFHVLTERELLSGPLSTNVRLMHRFRRSNLDEALLSGLAALVAPGTTTLAELMRRFTTVEPAIVVAAVFHLVAVGRLDFDPSVPFSEAARLFPGGTLPWDPFDSAWGASGCSTSASIASSGSRVLMNSSPKM